MSDCGCWPTARKPRSGAGSNTERFKLVAHSLAGVAGKRLQLELFDNETGGWGHIMLDHVLLTRRESGIRPGLRRR